MQGLKYIITFLSLFLSVTIFVFSQTTTPSKISQIATTEEGRKVILKSDNTWEYQKEAPTKSNSSANTNSILASAKYDRFTDLSIVSVFLDSLKEREGAGASPLDVVNIDAEMAYQGQIPKNIEKFSIKLTYLNVNPNLRIADATKAYLVADGQRFEIPFEYPYQRSWLVVEIPLDVKARIAVSLAKKVELKVSQRTIEFSQSQIERIRSLIQATKVSDNETNDKNATKQNAVSIKKVSSLIEVASDIPSFIDVPVKVNAGIKLSSYYMDGYKKAQTTHLAFELKDKTGWAYLYMPRGEKAQKLREMLIQAGANATLNGTFTIIIKKERFVESISLVAELLDYAPPESM